MQSALFSRLSPLQIQFRAIFRGTAPPFLLRTPLFAEQDRPSDSSFPPHSPPPPSSSPDLLPFRPSFPLYLHPSPLSLAFLPTFPPLSPINKQTRALSRITRVHVRAHTPALQEVFVYRLHPFTHLPQFTVHQCIRCEGKLEKTFTYRTTDSLSIN